MYYSDKIDCLKDIFGTEDVFLRDDQLKVGGRAYPIVDDVIVLLDSSQYTSELRQWLRIAQKKDFLPDDFADEIQYTFGKEWQKFPYILPEHEHEFLQYFDLIDLRGLRESRVCDLGCGIGRWSYFIRDKCRELILIDFSESIFVARRNLAEHKNALFFMADLKRLPFRDDFSDFLFCLGVLHHLPTPSLEEVRALRKYAPRLLFYLYYKLDNRPRYFQALLAMADLVRRNSSRVRNPFFRSIFTWFGALFLYQPFLAIGKLLNPFGLSRWVPLYESYRGKSYQRIRQDVYDRFFTSIEQRFSREEILGLDDSFSRIDVSERWPFWHFVCHR